MQFWVEFLDISDCKSFIINSRFLQLCCLVFSQRFRPQGNNFAVPFEQARPAVTGFSCPEKNGRYPTRTCDGYIECKDGEPEEKLCFDGLLFNPAAGVYAYPCQYPIDVDCTGREQTRKNFPLSPICIKLLILSRAIIEPAQATEDCPHQYGYFRLGDANNCGQFMNCAEGRGYTFDCPEGLAYNGDTYRCDWPDQVESCNSEGIKILHMYLLIL